MSSEKLSNRDYTLIIDQSGSMEARDQPGNLSRWQAARESAMAVAAKCEQFDPDGIKLYLFNDSFQRFDNVTAKKVIEIFDRNRPGGTTDLAGVLRDAFDLGPPAGAGGFFGRLFGRKPAAPEPVQAKVRPETIVVLTDGQPDDEEAVVKAIVEATNKISSDEQLALSIIQIGGDAAASQFLKKLDEQLKPAGAKFDICDTVTIDDMEDMSLSEMLLSAIND